MSDIRFEGWLHRTGTGGVYQDSAGNVGIASTQPKTRLDIQNGAFQIGPAGICTATTVNTTNLINETSLSHRNLIINGAMQVAQRGTSSTAGSGYHTIDRYSFNVGGTDETPTVAQVDVSSGTTPYTLGFKKALKITNGNQTGGAGAADYMEIYQYLEDQDISNSGWNFKSSSSYITVSFWIKSSVAQKFTGFFYTNQAGAGDSYMYSYQIDNGSGGSLTADTWTKITHSIPGNSSLSFNNDNTRGLAVGIYQFNGTNYTTSDKAFNAWSAWDSSAKTRDMTSTWYTTNDATLEITGLQLEVGSVATPFEHRSYGEQEIRCQRYYYRQSAAHQYMRYDCNGQCPSANGAQFVFSLPVRQRANATIGYSALTDFYIYASNLQSKTPTAITLSAGSTKSPMLSFDKSSTFSAGAGAHLTTPNSQQGYIEFIAEL